MTTISKNVYISKLQKVAKECNNINETLIEIPADVKPGTCINFGSELNIKIPNFETDDHL